MKKNIIQKDRFRKHAGFLILPLLFLLAGGHLLRAQVIQLREEHLEERRSLASANAVTYSDRIIQDLQGGVLVTNSLEEVIISGNGRCPKFRDIASDLMDDSIQSIQLAPGGVVTEIYPEEGNDAGKIDLLYDTSRGAYARYAMEHNTTVLQGPFELKQGGSGIAIRNPVYLEKNGKQEFWGFAIAIIRVPEIFTNSLGALKDFGYEYRLMKTTAPWSGEFTDVYQSGTELTDPVSYSFSACGDTWQLQVMPSEGWVQKGLDSIVQKAGIVILLLISGLGYAVIALEDQRRSLKRLSMTDHLTDVYNRSGFDQMLDRHLKMHPNSPCVVAELDIDDFKFINDMYGHASGDQALQNLTSGMKAFFPKSTIIGRNGGDEFCLLLPGQTIEAAQSCFLDFTESCKDFTYEGIRHPFTISLGFAEYPAQAQTRKRLMQCADTALYEVKLNGKQGCQAYESDPREARAQLGFALKDISAHLPGAFLIYKADPQDDQLLYANHEMVHLAGCDSIKDFFDYTKRSFRNLISEPEQTDIEESIWQQINEGDGHSNDYVSFSLVRKDGTLRKVFDHGRIVNNSYYGRVFYVLLMDQELMGQHYGIQDK